MCNVFDYTKEQIKKIIYIFHYFFGKKWEKVGIDDIFALSTNLKCETISIHRRIRV